MEAILLRQDVDYNAHVAAQLSAENRRCFDDLNETAVTAVHMEALAGVTVEQCLRTLLARGMEVMSYDIRHEAAGALAATQLRHGGLRGLEPGFPPWSSFCS